MPHKGGLAQERKVQIIKATLLCINKQGYNNLSMQDVAKQAGISKGIIHYYFKNKQDLMASLLEMILTEIEVLLLKIDTEKSAYNQLLQFFDIYFHYISKNKDKYSINIDFWSQINQIKIYKDILLNHYNKVDGITLGIINFGINEKKFTHSNPKTVSILIIAMIEGIFLQISV